MHHFKKFALAVALGSLALPAGAAAHERPTPATVASHIRSADQALDMVSSRVAANDDAAAAIQFALNRRHTHAATREAAGLPQRGKRRAPKAARAVRLVGIQQDENAEVFADLVDQVDGALQTGMAHAINTSLKGREQAVATLTSLMARLPARAQAGISRAIAALSSSGADEVQDLSEALQSGALPEEARTAVTTALGHASAGINIGLDRLRELVPQLPAQAQPPVQGAIDRIGPPIPGGLPIPEGLPIPRGLPIPSGPFS